MKTFSLINAIEMIFGCIFWGAGYLFGFSLVSLLTAGMVYSEEFSALVRGRETPRRFWMYMHEGKFYLIAEVVGAIGWIFLTAIGWGLLSLSGMI